MRLFLGGHDPADLDSLKGFYRDAEKGACEDFMSFNVTWLDRVVGEANQCHTEFV